MKQKIRINESQLRAIVAESVKKVLNENYDGPDQSHLRTRLITKWIEGLKRKGLWDEFMTYYNRGPEAFLIYIAPCINMPGFLTPEEESDDWDVKTPYDFSKIDAEDREREENALRFSRIGYNPYVD